jgi:hypothetical protein
VTYCDRKRNSALPVHAEMSTKQCRVFQENRNLISSCRLSIFYVYKSKIIQSVHSSRQHCVPTQRNTHPHGFCTRKLNSPSFGWPCLSRLASHARSPVPSGTLCGSIGGLLTRLPWIPVRWPSSPAPEGRGPVDQSSEMMEESYEGCTYRLLPPWRRRILGSRRLAVLCRSRDRPRLGVSSRSGAILCQQVRMQIRKRPVRQCR